MDDPVGNELRSPLMMKLFFRGELSPEENLRFFEKLQHESYAFAYQMTAVPSEIETYAELIGDPQKALYWKMTLEYGRMYVRMYHQWLESCIRQLEEWKNEYSGD